MTHPVPSLYLITPVLSDVAGFRPVLDAACGAGEITAVLLRLAPADDRTLVNRIKEIAPLAQARGAAIVVADSGPESDLAALVTRGGADGAHTDNPVRLRSLGERLKDGRNVGAGGLKTKHDAMVAGELGVDYVLFGEPRRDGSLPDLDLVLERAGWWAEIFQIPCVAYAPRLADLPAIAATGAEFVALGEIVWSHPDGPAAALAQVRAALAHLPETAA